jgi:ABC-2 type transport system permease protein
LARPVADASPMAAEAAGFTAREARGNKVTRVVSPTISVRQRLKEIWLSRELLVYLVRTEIKVKYKNSVLGLVWSMISPAMTLAIYFIVFQYISKNGIPHFVIFLFAGLLLWNLFQLGVQAGTGVIVNNAGIVKKVSFPREILALAAVGSACVFFFFQAIVMVIFLIVFHSAPAWNYLPLLPLALLAALVLASGLAILLCAVNVYLRDTQHLIEVVMTAWFWACPIVYSFQNQLASRLGQRGLTWLYFLNPMTPLVLSFQRALYAHVTVHSTVPPHLIAHELPGHGFAWYAALDVGVLGAGLVLCYIALVVFGRLEGNFAEEL